MGIFKYYPSNPKKLDHEMEKRIFFHSLILPTAFIFAFFMVEIAELTLGISLVKYGVFPLEVKGLQGILFSPFIHSDFNHLVSNAIPFFILMAALIYFYRRISYRIFILLYLIAGASLWFFGRPAWHIGASGVVYALAAFHLVSGIIRNDVRLLTLSIVVVFLYGGLIWGLFPIDPTVSWEGHLWGAISGIILAIYYRKYLIRRDKFDWEEDDDDEEDDNDDKNEYQNQINTPERKDSLSKISTDNTNHTGEYL